MHIPGRTGDVHASGVSSTSRRGCGICAPWRRAGNGGGA